MAVTDALKLDHVWIRKELAFVSLEIPAVSQGLETINTLCYPLLQLLKQHVTREEPLLFEHRDLIHPSHRHRMLHEYVDQREVLQDIELLLSGAVRMSACVLTRNLKGLFEELHEHMEEQERVIFPAIKAQYAGLAMSSLAGLQNGI